MLKATVSRLCNITFACFGSNDDIEIMEELFYIVKLYYFHNQAEIKSKTSSKSIEDSRSYCSDQLSQPNFGKLTSKKRSLNIFIVFFLY